MIREQHLYIDDIPPWHIAFAMALQHYIVMFVSTFTVPFIYASAMCLSLSSPDLSDVVNTLFFVSGVTTLLQTTIGVRLPIIQGASVAFLLPILSILQQPKWRCSETDLQSNSSLPGKNENATFLLLSDGPDDNTWKDRMREISGDIMVASILQIFIGVSGLIGVMLRHIGPLTIAPVITVLGISLFKIVADMCALQWGISMLMVILITTMSQIFRRVKFPVLRCCSKKSQRLVLRENTEKKLKILSNIPFIRSFSFIISLLFVWLLCYICTIAGAFGHNQDAVGYHARTDLRMDSLKNTKWFRIPYPFQFGTPTVSFSGALGMCTAVIASVVESVGDYYACAKVSGAPPPPNHAINRGIMTEGFGCLLSGMFGAGIGSTSYSQNIALLSLSKIGSRRVLQLCAAVTIILALFGKFAALFVTIPLPVVGGMFMVMFGMITAVGLSNLQYVNLNSTRNLYILGSTIFIGVSIPAFIDRHPDYIQTGYPVLDQMITVLLSNGMLVSGVLGFLLDNVIPGTDSERGIRHSAARSEATDFDISNNTPGYDIVKNKATYNIPHTSRLIGHCSAYLPFCQRI